jgi:hypothetical protein
MGTGGLKLNEGECLVSVPAEVHCKTLFGERSSNEASHPPFIFHHQNAHGSMDSEFCTPVHKFKPRPVNRFDSHYLDGRIREARF